METRITIDSIVEFIRKAINYNFDVKCYQYNSDYETSFEITDNKTFISIHINNNNIVIKPDLGYFIIDNILSDRDKLKLETLRLDIKERNKKVALNIFNNFFSNEEKKLTDINNLDNEDD